jgi:hypothetical protein
MSIAPLFDPYRVQLSDNAREDESKFMSLMHHPAHELGYPLLQHCLNMGSEGYSNPSRIIRTAQFDNNAGTLLEHGITVRNRSTLDRFGKPTSLDICIKVNPSFVEGSFLSRAEYEASVTCGLDSLDFAPLLEKYPEDTNPELPELISFIKNIGPSRQFTMDTVRNRHVLDIPLLYLGIPENAGKKAVIELNDDAPEYFIQVKGTGQKLIFRQDREIEFELLTEPCEYDDNPGKHRMISASLTREDKREVFSFMNDLISNQALSDHVRPNSESKAHRGFRYKNELMTVLTQANNHLAAPEILSGEEVGAGCISRLFLGGPPCEGLQLQ